MANALQLLMSSFGGAVPSWLTWNGSLNGASAVYSAGNASGNNVALLDTNKVIAVYTDVANSSKPTAVIGTISGTTITWGTPVVFCNVGSTLFDVTVLSATRVVVAYFDSTQGAVARILDISGTTITTRNEDVYAFVTINSISVTTLSSTAVVVVWDDADAVGGKGTSIVLTVSGTDLVSNSTFDFAILAATYCTLAPISSTQVLVIYTDGATTFGVAQVLNISGTTISGNTVYTFKSSIVLTLYIAQISSGVYAIAYNNNADSGFSAGQILAVSGTVVTYGSSVRIINLSASGGFFNVAKADANNAYFIYRNVTTTQAAAVIGAISGTTLTLQTPVVIKASVSSAMAACNIDNTHVMNVFRDVGNSNKGTGLVSSIV